MTEVLSDIASKMLEEIHPRAIVWYENDNYYAGIQFDEGRVILGIGQSSVSAIKVAIEYWNS